MRYVIRKLATMILTILMVSLLVFLAFSVIPGDPATQMLGTNATPQKLAEIRAQMGLDRPLLIRYFDWIKAFFFGNMGISYTYHVPVKQMLADKLPIMLTLTGLSFALILLLSIPLGILTPSSWDMASVPTQRREFVPGGIGWSFPGRTTASRCFSARRNGMQPAFGRYPDASGIPRAG